VDRRLAPFLLVLLASLLTYHIVTRIDIPNHPDRLAFHEKILQGEAPAPYRYRILVPATLDWLRNQLARSLGERGAFQVSFAIYEFLSLLMLLSCLYIYLREWFSPAKAMLGTLLSSATMLVTLADHFYQPWSLLGSALFPAALILIRRKWTLAFLFLVFIGALNRETSVFLPMLFVLGHWTLFEEKNRGHIPRKAVLIAGLAFAVWLGTQISLRGIYGRAETTRSLAQLLDHNLEPESLQRTAKNLGQFLLPFVFFVVQGFKRSPPFIKRITVLAPVYLLVYLVWGIWFEVRLLMPLYPILAALTLFGLPGAKQKESISIGSEDLRL